ncbi:HDOD domain-containing protein [Marinobacter caseinilyticus]|uniref:HDOD domain-containing protein n=1 Tax=Marinobacter caseinilyticus TaxID=2692195 RepID=UPI00140C67BC|nr:HDOD domain-containing protein [Marinobacter caseinilyticus]
MTRFLSRLTGLFLPRRTIAPANPSRLLNPAHETRQVEHDVEPQLQAMEDHLFCWLLDTPPSTFAQPSSHQDVVLDELRHRIKFEKLDELPRQPLSLPMLLQALSDDTMDRNKLAKIILSDASLVQQLLQVVNSPFFRPGEHTVESLDQAIFVLGIDGIRSVISATLLRPMLAARNSNEALFAQRVWRWGLACARSAELIAQSQGGDTQALFMVGLLPALSYITIRREVQRIYRSQLTMHEIEPQVLRAAMKQFDWQTTQMLANEWNLPPTLHAQLLTAERPAPTSSHTPLNDGFILGTREVLLHAHQRNLPEAELRLVLRLSDDQFARIRKGVLNMLGDGMTTSSTS